jgi:hypothetical protein
MCGREFTRVTQHAMRWQWLLVSLILSLAAVKSVMPKKQDNPLRILAFAFLFLCSVSILAARIICIVLFERSHWLIWRLCRGSCVWVYYHANNALYKASQSWLGKVVVGVGACFLFASSSWWLYLYVDLTIVTASIKFLVAIPTYLGNYPELAAAAEDWIQAWFLRYVMDILRSVAVEQKLLIEQHPVWSLFSMLAVLGCMLAVWVVLEAIASYFYSILKNCTDEEDEASAQEDEGEEDKQD